MVEPAGCVHLLRRCPALSVAPAAKLHTIAGMTGAAWPEPTTAPGGPGERDRRLAAPAIGLAMAAGCLGLLYYWYAVADRYVVFLYGHVDSGRSSSSPATPFDAVTSSRYWMSGFVAAGAVSMIFLTAVVVAAAMARRRGLVWSPPARWRPWLWAALLVAPGVPLIVMTRNQPTLPPALALAVTAGTLLGLALALAPGPAAARGLGALAWWGLHGLVLAPAVLLWRVVELPERGIVSTDVARIVVLGSVLAAGLALLVLRAIRRRRRMPAPRATQVLAATLWWALLVVPLVHHLVFTPPEYRYISSAGNVVGFEPVTALAALLLACARALAAAVE